MKKTIAFKSDSLLQELINLAAPRMKMKKGEFISFCITSTIKAYIPDLHDQFSKGEFPDETI